MKKTSEYGYLIELGDPKAPEYFSIKCYENLDGSIRECYGFWSQDAYDAIRFSRRIDAEEFLCMSKPYLTESRIVEHCFVDDERS